MILAIDPGTTKSAYVFIDDNLKPDKFGIVENDEMLQQIELMAAGNQVVIEMVACYGMPVGESVFTTCRWIGRFEEAAIRASCRGIELIERLKVKNNICHSSRATDSNIRQALIDRFGEAGTKKNPGWFYGIKKDIWAAYALAVTYHDLFGNKTSTEKVF